MTFDARTIYIVGLLVLSGCETPPISNTATSDAICDVWADTLILPSRKDTLETAQALNHAVNTHERVCK